MGLKWCSSSCFGFTFAIPDRTIGGYGGGDDKDDRGVKNIGESVGGEVEGLFDSSVEGNGASVGIKAGDLVPVSSFEENGGSVGVEVGSSVTLDGVTVTSSLLNKFDSLLVLRSKRWGCLKQRKGSALEVYIEQSIDQAIKDQPKGSKKDDDTAVPTHLWLHWLNEGVSKVITVEQWDTFIPVLQEQFLLLRWRRNLTRSFWKWFKGKNALKESKGVGELVVLVDGKWKWRKGGRLCYCQAWILSLSSRLEDVEGARDCIQRACDSSWWEWLAGSRPFFWR